LRVGRFGVGDLHAAIDSGRGEGSAVPTRSEFTERETLFIGQRDAFYLALISETGWPDVQHRGGAPGFIRAIDPKTLIFPEFAGAVTRADTAIDDRVAIVFMDYAKSRRLKVIGRLRFAPLEDAPYLAAELFPSTGELEAERVGSIRMEAFSWSRPRHITRRYAAAELAPLTRRVSALEAENAILQARIAILTGQRT
jgi:predicted pyridoxine 5'-phosphate oxidase superfamily flavin-nucleotide-binding protein